MKEIAYNYDNFIAYLWRERYTTHESMYMIFFPYCNLIDDKFEQIKCHKFMKQNNKKIKFIINK